jgi:hypothetical protein
MHLTQQRHVMADAAGTRVFLVCFVYTSVLSLTRKIAKDTKVSDE